MFVFGLSGLVYYRVLWVGFGFACGFVCLIWFCIWGLFGGFGVGFVGGFVLFVVYDGLRLYFVGLDLLSMYLLVIAWWLCRGWVVWVWWFVCVYVTLCIYALLQCGGLVWVVDFVLV